MIGRRISKYGPSNLVSKSSIQHAITNDTVLILQVTSKQIYQGVVDKEPLSRMGRSPGKLNR